MEAECVAAKDAIISALGEAGFILRIPKMCIRSFYAPSEKISRLQSIVLLL